MLTMFEITLGNWMPPCRVVFEHVSEAYMLFALVHKFLIGFSVVSVITGVFIQETFKVATNDDQIMVAQREMQVKTHTKKMSRLFKKADESGDGLLNRAEFEALIDDPATKLWLSAMDLDVNDATTLFELLDGALSGPGQISAADLVQGSAKLKGPARSIDLMTMMADQRKDQEVLHEICAELRELRELRAAPGAAPSGAAGSGAPAPHCGGPSLP